MLHNLYRNKLKSLIIINNQVSLNISFNFSRKKFAGLRKSIYLCVRNSGNSSLT